MPVIDKTELSRSEKNELIKNYIQDIDKGIFRDDKQNWILFEIFTAYSNFTISWAERYYDYAISNYRHGIPVLSAREYIQAELEHLRSELEGFFTPNRNDIIQD